MSGLNIAVWTVGEHARRNMLSAIGMCESVNLVGIFTRNIDVLTSQSKLYSCHAYNDSRELLLDLNVEAVYISSPNAIHYDQVKECLINNKHVIVEKSAFSSLEQAQEANDLAKIKRLVIMEAFMFLYHRQFSYLKELIGSERYGRILFLEASFGFPHLCKDNIRYSKELSGGALSDAGAYTICAILNLLGSDSELVFSKLNTEDGYEVDTSGMAIFMKNDIKGVCKWAMGGSYKNEIHIWFEKGHVTVERAFSKPDTFESKIEVKNNGKVIEVITSGKDNHFINMLKVFSNLSSGRLLKENANTMLQAEILNDIKTKFN